MILSFQTDRSGQNSADPEQSDQGLHCLQFRLYLLDALLYGKASLFNFRVTTANFSSFTVGLQ